MSTTQYSLDQYKTDAQRQLEEKRRNTQQAADINHQKLLKYLPQQTKGYSIGMTETAKIAANNAYQRQLAEADAAYTDGMTELNNYVRQEQERLDDKAKAEQEKTYNEIMSAVQNGEYNTTADLERYLGINDNKDGFGDGSIAAGLSDFQQANLLNSYNKIANDPVQVKADKARTAQLINPTKKTKTGSITWSDADTGFLGLSNNAADPGDNIEVKNPGASNETLNVEYEAKIEGDGKTTVFDAFKADNGREPKDGEVFGYDGKIYVCKNGVLWTLTGRGGSTGTGDYGELYKHYFG